MPNTVDPDNLRGTDDLYAAGRAAFEGGASVLENPWPGTGHIGRAWFAGWLDGEGRAVRAYPHLMADARAELFRSPTPRLPCPPGLRCPTETPPDLRGTQHP